MTQDTSNLDINSPNDTANLRQHASSQDSADQPCSICYRSNCNLQTHREYALQVARHRGRRPAQSTLTETSFAYSYAFNPLAVAIRYVCGELRFTSCPDELEDNVHLSFVLHTFISDGISRNIPFTDPAGVCDVAGQWLTAAAADELACTSTLILWATIEWRKTGDLKFERFASRLTALFLVILRNRVESGESVSPGTIFAASNHLSICSMYFDQTEDERNVMMNGLEALVDKSGGLEGLAESQTGLLQSLLWSDVLHSWNTGSRPRFRVPSPPRPPVTLMPMLTAAASDIPEPYVTCCGPDLLDSAKYLKFFLLFRHSSEVRALTKVEYRYMVQLERAVHFQLLEQQARYHHTDTVEECIVLAMAIVRMSILCVWDQHAQVRRVHAERLSRAMSQVPRESWMGTNGIYPLIWICWVLLAQSETCYDQGMVLQLMTSGLKNAFGQRPAQWPRDWNENLPHAMMPLLWHSDYVASMPRVANLVEEYLANQDTAQAAGAAKVEDSPTSLDDDQSMESS